MAHYAIGDIQGCYDELQCVLKSITFNPNTDTLWVAGDMVNRGPKSLETLDYLMSLGKSAKVVLGNHDLHLLAVAMDTRKPTKKDTLDAILAAPHLGKIIDWLRATPLLHCDKKRGYLMVHAGLAPQWDVKKAQQLASEVESVLRSDQVVNFLQHMYGNRPACWDDSLQGWERMRTITNYFTRMRLCTADGELNLEHKTGLDNAPKGFKPWFAHSRRQAKDINILFGHWAALEGKSNENRVFALDTGCVWGGRLSVMRLKDQRVFSCACGS